MSEQPKITGVRTIAVPVTDQDRAVEFYVGTLGLEKRLDAPMEQLGGRWIEVAAPGAQTSLALTPANQGTPAGVETGVRLVTPDAAVLHKALTEAGVDADDLLLWDGIPPMFVLRDPDGNGLAVVEERGEEER
ncbi:VOC family protein [Spirillospora sp. CA-294931]|uniref:VOC family protein n=1 Tax=Spirillospora sp. CA-294931 TaxID=3240042 RepID=UPI003D919B67